MLRYVILVGSIWLTLVDSKGATYYTASSGDLGGNIWATTTNGTPGPLPALANGDIIYIDDNVSIPGPPGNSTVDWSGANLTIYLNATLDIDGQWLLSATTIVYFQSSSAKVISSGGGNSDKIKFGNGNNGWSGNEGNLTGPGQLDQNFGDGTGSPLPIELLFFKAIQSGQKVALSWSTASELNFDYFSVERSSSGVDFQEIEQVRGHGTTNERKDYKLADNFPLIGKNYYRLKSVDYDGYTEYFKVAVVNFSGEKTFNVSPNPSDGATVTFAMNFVPDNTTTITIFDNFSSTIEVVKPTDHWQSVNFTNSLKSGLYFARIVTKDFVRVERFIVR